MVAGRPHRYLATIAGGVMLLAGLCLTIGGLLAASGFELFDLEAKGDPSAWRLVAAGAALVIAVPFVVALISGQTKPLRRGALALACQMGAVVVTWPLALVVSNYLAPFAIGLLVGGCVALRPPSVDVTPWRAAAVGLLVLVMVADDLSNGPGGAVAAPFVVLIFGLPLVAIADSVAERYGHAASRLPKT